jgi:hypothetical protein
MAHLKKPTQVDTRNFFRFYTVIDVSGSKATLKPKRDLLLFA